MIWSERSESTPTLSEQMPQFAEAKWKQQSIKEKIKATKALSYPSIGLSADYGTFYASSNPERTFEQQLNDTRNGSISIGLSIPILRRLQNRSQVQELKINEMMVQNELDKTRIELNQKFNITKSRYENFKKRFETATTLYQLAEENMKLVQNQVDVGTATMVDFLLAQNNMERALNSLTQTKYQYIHQEKLLTFYTTGKFDFGE